MCCLTDQCILSNFMPNCPFFNEATLYQQRLLSRNSYSFDCSFGQNVNHLCLCVFFSKMEISALTCRKKARCPLLCRGFESWICGHGRIVLFPWQEMTVQKEQNAVNQQWSKWRVWCTENKRKIIEGKLVQAYPILCMSTMLLTVHSLVKGCCVALEHLENVRLQNKYKYLWMIVIELIAAFNLYCRPWTALSLK